MGSWNQTCMLSNMPVTCGEPVVSIFLLAKPPAMINSPCYATAFWNPLPLILYGEYNDYGSVENFSGPHQEMILDYFKRNAVEMEQGENQYHDVPVKRSDLTLESVLDIDHEGRLFVPCAERHGGQRAVDHIVIKKTLFERIISDTVIDAFMEEPGHQIITFESLMQGIDEATVWIKEFLMDSLFLRASMRGNDGPPTIDDFSMISHSIDQLTRNYGNTDIPPQAAWLRRKDWIDPDDSWAYYFCTSEHEVSRELLIERMKFGFLEHFMNAGRYTWHVPGHSGSQTEERFPYLLMSSYMSEELARRAAYFNEDEDEDEDEDEVEDLTPVELVTA